MSDSPLPHASPPLSDTSVSSRRTIPDDVIILVAQHLCGAGQEGASTMRALQLCSSGYRAATPDLYRPFILRGPGALPTYQEVLRGLTAHGVAIDRHEVWKPKFVPGHPSTIRYLVDAFSIGDQASLDVYSGVSRTIRACRHVRRLVFKEQGCRSSPPLDRTTDVCVLSKLVARPHPSAVVSTWHLRDPSSWNIRYNEQV